MHAVTRVHAVTLSIGVTADLRALSPPAAAAAALGVSRPRCSAGAGDRDGDGGAAGRDRRRRVDDRRRDDRTGLGPRRSRVADGRRVRDHRGVRRSAAGDRAGGARRQRLHRARAPARPAARAAGLLPRALPGPRRPAPLERAGGRQLRHRAGGRADATCRWSSRPTRWGRAGGSIRPSTACRPTRACSASSPTCSSTSATPSTPTSRWAWPCRSTTAAPGAACRARPRPSRPRRVDEYPRQLPLQPAGRAHAPLQPVGGAAHRVGRPRGARQLVPGAAPGRRPALRGGVGGAAGGARPPGVLRVHAAADRRPRSRAAVPPGALRSGRGVPARLPQLPRRQQRQSPAVGERGDGAPRRGAAGLAEGGARREHRARGR